MRAEESSIRLCCVGTGDAFGSGGRLNSCYHFTVADQQLLIDCGSSSLIGLQQCGLAASRIGAVVVSHLHGDHFGGIPYLLLEGQFASRRKDPLLLAGPAGLQAQVEAACEALYPGALSEGVSFPVTYRILDPALPLKIGPAVVSCLPVKHGKSEQVYGLRLEVAGKVVSYTGDTEWTDTLLALTQGSDLLIAECFAYEQPVPSHLDYRTLLRQLSRMDCRRIVLTHMGPEMLERLEQLTLETLNDGDVLVI